MKYTKENWNECLESLHFTEQVNPNGFNCFDVYDDNKLPKWQYETMEQKKRLFDFFCGMAYMKIKLGVR